MTCFVYAYVYSSKIIITIALFVLAVIIQHLLMVNTVLHTSESLVNKRGKIMLFCEAYRPVGETVIKHEQM